MNHKIRTLAALLGLFVFAGFAFGQASLASTTLSAAVTGPTAQPAQKTIVVASASSINAPGNQTSTTEIGTPSGNASYTVLVVDKEAMQVLGVSGTTITVARGYQGTIATSHASGAKVWVGPPEYFYNFEQAGSCTATSLRVLPAVVLPSGNIYNCGNGVWTTFGNYVNRLTVGATLTAAATIAPTNPVHHITGATTITTITPPPAFPATGGCVTLIPDLAGVTSSTGGNIALATTVALNKALTLCYDPGTSKWYPSY